MNQPFFLAGAWESSNQPLPVTCPYDNSIVATTWLAGDEEFERATQAAVDAAAVMRRVPAYERAAILMRAHADLVARREEIGRTIAGEAGKALRDALAEADRGTQTFQVAAEEARRIGGEVIPMDLAPHGRGRVAFTRRYPIGPIAGISPFNFPFNLTAHKLAPAIAAGNPIVLKPATKTPLSALILADALDKAGLPKGALSVLPMSRQTGDRLVTDERYKLLTFTGSSAVGWGMKARAGKKKVVLELGGNAGVIVDETADLDYAAKRIAVGGFALAGQSCISVQRVFVHASVFDRFASALCARVEALKVGDPLDPATDVGPMIEESEAARIESWVNEAVQRGRARTHRRPAARAGALRAHRARRRAGDREGLRAGGVRAGRRALPVRGVRRRARPRQSFLVRPAGRRLHERSRPRARRDGRPRGGRRHGQRRVGLAHRPHAVRRREGLGHRPRRARATPSRR